MRALSGADRERTRTLDAAGLRSAFLIEDVFRPSSIELVDTGVDRAIVGGVVPRAEMLPLVAPTALRAETFCARRELGVLNLGGPGTVDVDAARHRVGHLDVLYVGRGATNVRFGSDDPATPAVFWLVSYPAHASHPHRLVRRQEAATVELGSTAGANRRVIRKYVRPPEVPSSQLVMGVTTLAEGSVWNTQPPHTHERRSEVYLYFDLAPDARVFHFMGTPQDTRHIVVADRQAVVAPPWSIHMGCGTGAYSFCWAMGGENQDFDDMDPAPLAELR